MFYLEFQTEHFSRLVSALEAHSLAKIVHRCLRDTCERWARAMPCDVPCTPDRAYTVSSHAIRNTRRKMEDRHVVIHDLNTLYNLSVSNLWSRCKFCIVSVSTVICYLNVYNFLSYEGEVFTGDCC